MRMKNLATMLSALMLATAGCSDSRSPEQNEAYLAAANNPALRPAYVSNVCKRVTVPSYVKSVEYYPTQDTNISGNGIMQNNVSSVFRGDSLDRADSGIQVFPLAFSRTSGINRVHCDADFVFALKNHEFKHSELHNVGGLPILRDCVQNNVLDKNLFDILSELEAYNNEVSILWGVNDKGIVRKPGNRDLSFDYAVGALNASMEYYTKLQDYASTNQDNPNLARLVEKYRLPHYKFAGGKK